MDQRSLHQRLMESLLQYHATSRQLAEAAARENRLNVFRRAHPQRYRQLMAIRQVHKMYPERYIKTKKY